MLPDVVGPSVLLILVLLNVGILLDTLVLSVVVLFCVKEVSS